MLSLKNKGVKLSMQLSDMESTLREAVLILTESQLIALTREKRIYNL